MSITLGDKPDSMTVWLTRHGDFTAGIRYQNGTWPAGLEVDLRFYPDKDAEHEVEWSASVSGDLISWYIPRATVIADVLDAETKLEVARLIYRTTSPTRELEWYTGKWRRAN